MCVGWLLWGYLDCVIYLNCFVVEVVVFGEYYDELGIFGWLIEVSGKGYVGGE